MVCDLRASGLIALITSGGCEATVALAREANRAHLPFMAVLSGECSQQWMVEQAYPKHSRRGRPGLSVYNLAAQQRRPGVFVLPHKEASDVQVVFTKLTSMNVDRALVLYDDDFAENCMKIFKDEARRTNMTMGFVPLDGNHLDPSVAVNVTLQRLKRLNTFYTNFAMVIFSNISVAEGLHTKLIETGIIDPNMRTFIIYTGFDHNVDCWFFPFKTRYAYEKLLYVIPRSYSKETLLLVRAAGAHWNKGYEQPWTKFLHPDVFALEFLRAILQYTTDNADKIPADTGCETRMDDFLEEMNRNVEAEIRHKHMSSSTASYKVYYLAPLNTTWYRLMHLETWYLRNGSFEPTVMLNEVDAYLNNKTLNVVLLEYPPYVVYDKHRTGKPTVNGTFLVFMNYLQEMYHFRASYQLLENVTSGGIRRTDYNWSGALGMLNKRETDWVTFVDITEERVRSFSLTEEFISHPVAILVQKPEIRSPKMLFAQPFSKQVVNPWRRCLRLQQLACSLGARDKPK
ncbi:glutamate receptor ionotropic, delta-1-like [Haemaphysalis longicornis]